MIDIINKAIEESDLLFLDNELIKPYTFDGEILSYRNLVSDEDMVVNVECDVKIVSYEEGIN